MIFPIKEFTKYNTPFYYYDIELLRATLEELRTQTCGEPFMVHYAVKANANGRLLEVVNNTELFYPEADVLSGKWKRLSKPVSRQLISFLLEWERPTWKLTMRLIRV